MNKLAQQYLRPSQIPTKACHGCGIGMIENWLLQAIDQLGFKQEDVVFGTGIGPLPATLPGRQGPPR